MHRSPGDRPRCHNPLRIKPLWQGYPFKGYPSTLGSVNRSRTEIDVQGLHAVRNFYPESQGDYRTQILFRIFKPLSLNALLQMTVCLIGVYE